MAVDTLKARGNDGAIKDLPFRTALGRAAEAESKSVALATEDLAAIGPVDEAAPGTDVANAGLNGRLKRVAQRLSSLIALFPTSIGRKADEASLGIALSEEDYAAIGAPDEASPGTDIAAAGLNGRLKRIAQRLSSLIALFPTSLGRKAAADGLPVSLSNEDLAAINALAGTNALPLVTSEVSTIGIAASQLRPANPNRERLRGQNLGPGILYLDENGTNPVIGDSYKVAVDAPFEIDSQEEIRAIASLAATKVRWTENA